MSGNQGFIKIRNKAQCYHKHGYNYGHLITYCVELNRKKRARQNIEPMYSSVREAFDAAKRK